MALYHSVTWQDGNFERTASILSFTSKAARDAYPEQCPQRVESINSKKKAALIKDGRLQRMVFWDKEKPLDFRIQF